MLPEDDPMYRRVMLSEDDSPHRRLMWALLNPHALKAAYDTAHVRADRLRKQLRELEIDITQAHAIINEMGLPSWPPLREPVRPPTLHQAMQSVLEAKGNRWMRTGQIAREIARRCLYRRRDGLPASTKDVSARASHYWRLFERQGAMIRLRNQLVSIQDE
jgi:hypothetical protein